MLQCQPGAQVDLGSETLLIQRAGADGQQANHHGDVGGGAGAMTGADSLANRQRDAPETEHEAQPLQRPYRFAKREAQDGSDDRHGADHERKEADIHAARGGQIESAELQRELQKAHHGSVQRGATARPGGASHHGERGIDQSRAGKAQHQHGEGRGVIEGDAGRGISGAPQNHERGAEYATRQPREPRIACHGHGD